MTLPLPAIAQRELAVILHADAAEAELPGTVGDPLPAGPAGYRGGGRTDLAVE